jgi:membrane protein implicated in regulation of membrane protease activity
MAPDLPVEFMDFYVYIVCLGAGLVFTLISLVAGHMLGADHIGSGGHAEAGADSTDGPGVSAFSPTMIAAFVASFGGFGIIFHEIPLTRHTWLSAPLAGICGLGAASALLWALRQLFRSTQSSSEGQVGTLVGLNATVISPIPQHGVGEIAYVQGGSRYTAPARTESGCQVASGQTVKINRITGSQFYVVPV